MNGFVLGLADPPCLPFGDMKLTEISLALLVLLVGALVYTSFDALKLQRENSAKMAEIHRYFDAVQDQLTAQKKLQAEADVPGLVAPMQFQNAAATPTVAAAPAAGTAGSSPEVAAPTTPEPPPAAVTAAPAPLPAAPALPAPVIDTPLMRVIREAPSIGAVTQVSSENGFVVLNAGSKSGLAEGQSYQLRRGASIVGNIRLSTVEEAEAVADLDVKSVPAGVTVMAGDQIISPVKLIQ
jgi:hypothetical protein